MSCFPPTSAIALMVPLQSIAHAQPFGSLASEDDVVGADADEEAAADGLIAVGNFELLTVTLDLADAPLSVSRGNFHVEDVFKAVLFDQRQDLGVGGDGEKSRRARRLGRDRRRRLGW